MASLLKVARQSCQIFRSNPNIVRKIIQPCCLVSTSKNNKDASATVSDASAAGLPKRPLDADQPIAGPNVVAGRPEVEESLPPGLAEKEENWISFGYDLTDRNYDEFTHHSVMFCGITLALVCGAFYLAYAPDPRDRQWATREAYLEIERRRSEGLPLVDANLVDPAKIELPSDEELGEREIII